MVWIGAGVYRRTAWGSAHDRNPDVLHDNWKGIRIYELARGQPRRRSCSIAPVRHSIRVRSPGPVREFVGHERRGWPVFGLIQHVDGFSLRQLDENLVPEQPTDSGSPRE